MDVPESRPETVMGQLRTSLEHEGPQSGQSLTVLASNHKACEAVDANSTKEGNPPEQHAERVESDSTTTSVFLQSELQPLSLPSSSILESDPLSLETTHHDTPRAISAPSGPHCPPQRSLRTPAGLQLKMSRMGAGRRKAKVQTSGMNAIYLKLKKAMDDRASHIRTEVEKGLASQVEARTTAALNVKLAALEASLESERKEVVQLKAEVADLKIDAQALVVQLRDAVQTLHSHHQASTGPSAYHVGLPTRLSHPLHIAAPTPTQYGAMKGYISELYNHCLAALQSQAFNIARGHEDIGRLTATVDAMRGALFALENEGATLAAGQAAQLQDLSALDARIVQIERVQAQGVSAFGALDAKVEAWGIALESNVQRALQRCNEDFIFHQGAREGVVSRIDERLGALETICEGSRQAQDTMSEKVSSYESELSAVRSSHSALSKVVQEALEATASLQTTVGRFPTPEQIAGTNASLDHLSSIVTSRLSGAEDRYSQLQLDHSRFAQQLFELEREISCVKVDNSSELAWLSAYRENLDERLSTIEEAQRQGTAECNRRSATQMKLLSSQVSEVQKILITEVADRHNVVLGEISGYSDAYKAGHAGLSLQIEKMMTAIESIKEGLSAFLLDKDVDFTALRSDVGRTVDGLEFKLNSVAEDLEKVHALGLRERLDECMGRVDSVESRMVGMAQAAQHFLLQASVQLSVPNESAL